jgi:hypothetical protein
VLSIIVARGFIDFVFFAVFNLLLEGCSYCVAISKNVCILLVKGDLRVLKVFARKV